MCGARFGLGATPRPAPHALSTPCDTCQVSSHAAKSDIIRASVIYHHGGLYMDTDFLVMSSLTEVRAPSRSMPPRWRSIRFRLALRTYAPRGCMDRTCGEPGEIKKSTHPKCITARVRGQVLSNLATYDIVTYGKRKSRVIG